MAHVSPSASRRNHVYAERTTPGRGSTDWLLKLAPRMTVMGECWIVDGKAHKYAVASIGGVMEQLHRAVYEEMNPGTDITDMHIHHECQHPGCINPAHLVALTPGEHRRRHVELRLAM